MKTKHIGNLEIREGDKNDYSKLKEVTGNLYINSNATLPLLESVGGYLYIDSNVTLPLLESVVGDLSIHSNATLPLLESVGGYLSIHSNVTLPLLESVGGYLSIHSNVTAELPLLESVGGYLYIHSNATLPLLESVVGDLSIHSNATLPLLESVGGYLYIDSNVTVDAPFLKQLNWKSVDGTLFVIEDEKIKKGITIQTGYVMIGVKKGNPVRKDCYVAEKDGFYAHGETLKKAVEDLQFKLISDRLKNEPIKADTIIDIKYYRLITGSCEMGVKSFMEANGLKERYKAKDLLPILEKKNAYGFEKFKSLCEF